MKTSPRGIALIKRFEGLRLTAYRCPAGVWTIGYGHTGPDVFEGLTITQDAADKLLERDLKIYEDAVNREVTVPLDSNQFDALVSFTYNLGAGNLRKSTLLKYVNQNKHQLAASEFLKWNKAGGVVLGGLVRRRKAERDLYLTPVE